MIACACDACYAACEHARPSNPTHARSCARMQEMLCACKLLAAALWMAPPLCHTPSTWHRPSTMSSSSTRCQQAEALSATRIGKLSGVTLHASNQPSALCGKPSLCSWTAGILDACLAHTCRPRRTDGVQRVAALSQKQSDCAGSGMRASMWTQRSVTARQS